MKKCIVSVGIPVMPHREHYISKCVKSVLSQSFSENYEIIIALHPGFNYRIKNEIIPSNVKINYLQSGASLSSKRNDIMKNSNSSYIINIDDDIIAETDWLINMINDAKKFNYDIFWGSAKPIYEKTFPSHLDYFEMDIGGFHYDRNGNLRRRGLIGCNFGFKNGLNHKRGAFLDLLGRGSSFFSDGEETLFFEECIDAKAGFINNSVVKHHIQKNRINFSYVIKNRCSNVRARILINKITKKNNIKYLNSRLKILLKTITIDFNGFKNIYFQFRLLCSAVFSFFLVLFFEK